MTLCRLLVLDATRGTGRFDEGNELYDRGDVDFGIDYAMDRLAAGYTTDPIDGFDLKNFKKFCETKLKELL